MKKKVWLDRLGFICLFLFVLTLVITIVINNPFVYGRDIRAYQLGEVTGLSDEALMDNFRQLLHYLNLPWVTELTLPDFTMSASAAFHFYEVKRLFLLNYGVLLVTIMPACFFIRSLVKRKMLYRLVRPCQIAFFVPIVFGFLMLVGFGDFFVRFHELFFNNDAWLFDPSVDQIILALPEAFFMHCFALFFVLLELFFGLGIAAGKWSLRRTKQ